MNLMNTSNFNVKGNFDMIAVIFQMIVFVFWLCVSGALVHKIEIVL